MVIHSGAAVCLTPVGLAYQPHYTTLEQRDAAGAAAPAERRRAGVVAQRPGVEGRGPLPISQRAERSRGVLVSGRVFLARRTELSVFPGSFSLGFDCPVGSGSRAGGPSAGPARPNPASMDPAAELVGYVNGREISPKLFSEDESLPLGSTQEPIFPPELMDPVQCRSLADKYESAIEDLQSRHPCSTLNYEVKYVWDVKDTFIWNPKACLLFPKEGIKKLMSVFLRFPKYIQDIVAVTLKLPANKVVCHAKRGGRMFEGKTNKTGIMAAITTFVANKHGRAVSFIVEREDMLITGGHHPYLGKYKAGFMNVGRMLALDMEYYSNGGASLDGLLFAQLISESWITEAAASCGLAPEKVRMMNMYRKLIKQEINAKALIQCWKECMSVSSFSLRKEGMEKFNSETYWKKKGLAVVPLKFSVSFGSVAAGQAAVLVPIYLDGSVLMTHSGIKMGQGVHTKMIQARVAFDESGSLAVAEYFRIFEGQKPGSGLSG
ncbi:aldehyde oxidase-like [Herpailurus yagouaroundi]|uniref:aldehyde oxidase-like n=1 Tax=Herpailurus yagouaroundi TaxID=1608482 RepID=UPI001AD70429|nr:aldehyde oxidase-like [Puma yagouaroundi]